MYKSSTVLRVLLLRILSTGLTLAAEVNPVPITCLANGCQKASSSLLPTLSCSLSISTALPSSPVRFKSTHPSCGSGVGSGVTTGFVTNGLPTSLFLRRQIKQPSRLRLPYVFNTLKEFSFVVLQY